ncbi:MAG: hypothetical protein ABL958_00895 [Bdellovibrionia bacterium]
MDEKTRSGAARIYNIVLKIAALIMAGFFLYFQIGPFLNWFGNK